jgi:hypothetical protein
MSNGFPMNLKWDQSTSPSISNSVSSTTTVVSSSFSPELGRFIWITLSGTWVGAIKLERSTDNGTTWLGITDSAGLVKGSWTINVNAPIVEDTVYGVIYRLNITLSGGTVTYKIQQ